jgi:hypothetical protein
MTCSHRQNNIRIASQLLGERLSLVTRQVHAILTDHVHRTDKRMTAIERDLTRLRSFRRRVLAVYSALPCAGLIWSRSESWTFFGPHPKRAEKPLAPPTPGKVTP